MYRFKGDSKSYLKVSFEKTCDRFRSHTSHFHVVSSNSERIFRSILMDNGWSSDIEELTKFLNNRVIEFTLTNKGIVVVREYTKGKVLKTPTFDKFNVTIY